VRLQNNLGPFQQIVSVTFSPTAVLGLKRGPGSRPASALIATQIDTQKQRVDVWGNAIAHASAHRVYWDLL